MSEMGAAVAALAEGRPVVVVDPVRQLGVAGLPAEAIRDDQVNFLVRHCRGILYAGIPSARLDELAVGAPVASDAAFASVRIPVDARAGVTTGISSGDRARTIRSLLDPGTRPGDLRTPGHVLPVDVEPAAGLGRAYLADALAGLSVEAGQGPGVALSAVLAPDGSLADASELATFGREHGCPVVDLAAVARHRRRRDGWEGGWDGCATVELVHHRTTLVVRATGVHQLRRTLPVAVLALCAAGQLLGSGCGCGDALARALARLDEVPAGAVAVVVLAGGQLTDGCTASSPGAAGSSDAGPARRRALADLLAAELVGGRATPLVHQAEFVHQPEVVDRPEVVRPPSPREGGPIEEAST